MDRAETGAAWATLEAETEGNASMPWSAERLTEENKAWLRQLPATIRVDARRAVRAPLPRIAAACQRLPAGPRARHGTSRASRATRATTCSASGTRTRPTTACWGQAHFVAAGSVGCGGEGDPRRPLCRAVHDRVRGRGRIPERPPLRPGICVARDMTAAGIVHSTCCACRRCPLRTRWSILAPTRVATLEAPARSLTRGGRLRPPFDLSRFVRPSRPRPGPAASDDAGQHDDRDDVRQRAKNCSGSRSGGRPADPAAARSGSRAGDPPTRRTAAPPRSAPSGVQRPKIRAASAMNPRPAVIPSWNELPNSSVRNAPPRPAKTPPG